MAEDWWTPEYEAAAREGFLANPVAVAYAKAQAENAVPLQAGGEVEVAGQRVAMWWSDRPSVVRVLEADGSWRAVDLAVGQGAAKLVTEWCTIPGTRLEIREVERLPHLRWHVRPIGVDPT